MSKITFFSSEHVSAGHPDKTMDAIVGALLDAYLNEDPTARFACDGLVKSNHLYIAGEITSKARPNHDRIVRQVVHSIGYGQANSPKFNDRTLNVHQVFTQQSPDIALGTNDEVAGAGDNGMMFGFAVKEAPDYTCHAHYLARAITYDLYHNRLSYMQPDQKHQVTIMYVDDKPVAVSDIVICVSHTKDAPIDEMKAYIKQRIDALLEDYKQRTGIDYQDYRLYINPTGSFVEFGPAADSGEVGRKLTVDSYGGAAAHGGGCWNGKDPSKVDMSASLMARKVAKDMVKANLADKVQIQVAYAIGLQDPISINIETFGTAKAPYEELEAFVNQYSFRPADIATTLHLRTERPFNYQDTGANGWIGQPFGDYQLPWE